MEWTKIPAGTLNRAQQRLWFALHEDAGEVADALNSKNAAYLADLAGYARKRAIKFARAQSGGKVDLFTNHKSVSLRLDTPIEPAMFYQNRDGLWVYQGFVDLVASKAKPLAAGTQLDINIFEIGEEDEATDDKIEQALPTPHLFDESAACAIIGILISNQSRGEGRLLTLRRRISFYTECCVIYVAWDPTKREWCVSERDRDLIGLLSGDQVITPAK